jgi:HEAT repeat protein
MNDIKHGQPELDIRGGVSRPSTFVDRSDFPELASRERVLSVLRARDAETREQGLKRLEEADLAIIRAIAQEGAAANAEPTVRYNAISALVQRSAAENLNLLTDLAEFGEDFYVRGHAVLALGAAGLNMALPLIAPHLLAEERFEQLAAQRAIGLVASYNSLESVRAYASRIQDAKLRPAFERTLDQLVEAQKKPRDGKSSVTPQRSTSSAPAST